MFIIWGTRSFFRTSQCRHFGFCFRCNQFSKFKSWNGTNFFHLYYFPLIPLEGRRRNHAFCAKCGGGEPYRLPDFENATLKVKEQSALALLAIQNAEKTFSVDDASSAEFDALYFLEHALKWFHACNDSDFYAGILEQLKLPGCQYAEAMLLATGATLSGKLDDAVYHYQNAAKLRPNEPEPLQRSGQLLVERGKTDLAIAAYQQAAELTRDSELELSILLPLAEQLMRAKRFAEAEQTLDRILTLHPPVAQDKTFSKMLGKAKKKAAALRPTLA
jgi:tetratricopeptide (TPR) repeat protein